MKKYLVASQDVSVADTRPRIVFARSADEALRKHQRIVISKEESFREYVLDLCINMTFAERFYLPSKPEQEQFAECGTNGTEPEIIKSRVKSFFASRPDIEKKYIRYMDTQDVALITDDVFEFIAVNMEPSEHGFIALDLDTIETLDES